MKVALVHDWLTGMRGGEKVLESMCRHWPNAPLYTLIHKRGSCSAAIEDRPIVTSFLQKLCIFITAESRGGLTATLRGRISPRSKKLDMKLTHGRT